MINLPPTTGPSSPFADPLRTGKDPGQRYLNPTQTRLLAQGQLVLLKLFLDDPESLRSHAVQLRQVGSRDACKLAQ